jgi:hypothetical protein
VDWVLKAEGEQGFGGEDDLLVAGESAAGGTGASASESADGCAFASAGDAAEESAQASAATDEPGGAFAFALFNLIDGCGRDGIAAPTGVNAVETHGEESAAFECAEGLGVDNGAFGASSAGDDGFAIDDHVTGDGGREGLAGLADLGAKVLIEADADVGAGGKDDNRRRRGCGWRG